MSEEMTKDEVEQYILKRWHQGASGAEIAKELGKTRNAILGWLHRARYRGLVQYRDIDKQMRKREAERKVKRTNVIPLPRIRFGHKKTLTPLVKPQRFDDGEQLQPLRAQKPAVPVFGRVRLLDLQPHHCRYAITELGYGDFMFCGNKRKVGSAYCDHHHAICHRAPFAPKNVFKKTARVCR